MLAGFLLLRVQGGLVISSYAFSKLFLKYFLPFLSWFCIECAKGGGSELVWAWLQLFEWYFLTSNSLLALLFSHTVFGFIFFWLFGSYFMVYKIQDIVKLTFYGYSLTGGGTTEIKRWRLSKDRMEETLELKNDCGYKGP